MYAIYAYIDPPNHPNVGIYDIYGVSGICLLLLPSSARLVMSWRQLVLHAVIGHGLGKN